MNETVKEQVDALTGANAAKAADGEDWKSRYEALKSEYDQKKPMLGRVEELSAKDRRISELEKENAELKSSRKNDELASALTEEERADIPDEVLNAATKIVNKGIGRLEAENERRFQEMEARRKEEEAALRNERTGNFLARIDSRFPGFRSSITEGGDKAQAWQTYLRYNAASIRSAFDANDFESFSYHVEKFYNDVLGIPVPSEGQGGSAAPDPASHGGGYTGSSRPNGKVYTSDEFMALYDALEVARDKGDSAEMARLNAEIKSAPAEGRVK